MQRDGDHRAAHLFAHLTLRERAQLSSIAPPVALAVVPWLDEYSFVTPQEMASREYAELEIIGKVAERMDVAVGIIDVKSYFIETPELVADKVRACLEFAPADRLVFAPDCGLSQTARWAARQKLENMVEGVRRVRRERGLDG